VGLLQPRAITMSDNDFGNGFNISINLVF